MARISDWIRSRKTDSSVQNRHWGLIKWLQVLSEQFSSMFRSNFLLALCLLPACFCLFFYLENQNSWNLLAAVFCFGLAAPALTAVFFVCMQAIRGNPIWVWDSFLKAYTRDGKKTILLGWVAGGAWLGFFRIAWQLLSAGGSFLVLVLLTMAGILLSGFSFFSFQQAATVELSLSGILRNGVLLIFAGKGRSLIVSLLTFAAILAAVWFSVLSYFAVAFGLSAILIMTGELVFYPVFEMLFLEEPEETAQP